MRWLSGIALIVPAVCWGGSIGVGAGVGLDLPDPGGIEPETAFGPSPSLLVPIRLDVASAARIRIALHAAFSQGRDVVTWEMPGLSRVGEQPKVAWLGALAATVGPEVRIPLRGGFEPYLAGGAGAALVYVWHNLERADLFDPAHYTPERLANDLTRDPFSRQPVFATDLAIGATVDRFWFELGYAVQFVAASALVHSTPALEARREAFGWNVVRIAAGFLIPVAGDRASPRYGAAPTSVEVAEQVPR